MKKILFLIMLAAGYSFGQTDSTLVRIYHNGKKVEVPQGSTNTDDQTISLSGNILTLENGGTVDLSAYLDNTDGQTITDFSLSGNILTLTISGGNTQTVDLSSIAGAGGGTDDQTAAEVSYDNTTSGLTATQMQAALDETVALIGGGGSSFDPDADLVSNDAVWTWNRLGAKFVEIDTDNNTFEVVAEPIFGNGGKPSNFRAAIYFTSSFDKGSFGIRKSASDNGPYMGGGTSSSADDVYELRANGDFELKTGFLIGSVKPTYTIQSTDYTALPRDRFIEVTAPAAITLPDPTTVLVGTRITVIHNFASGNITFPTNSNGGATPVLSTRYARRSFQSNGTIWLRT